jgi:hypothetical protein
MLHPDSLEAIVKGYLRIRGWEVDRGNEKICPGPGRGTLHGIAPHDMPHFDMNWRFKQGAFLEPMEESLGEQGKNILYWDPIYMDYYYRNYQFITVGRKEKEIIQQYFQSQHFQKSFELLDEIASKDATILHIHTNVEISIHPTIMEKFAIPTLVEKGWELDRAVPSVVPVQGIYYGKIIFLIKKPKVSDGLDFSITWVYNNEMIIAPCTINIFMQDDPGYLLVPKKDYDELLKQDSYIVLDDSEINECLSVVEV